MWSMAGSARKRAVPPSEAQIAAIWQRMGAGDLPLTDSAGRVFRVVFPGRRWGGPGPDFKGAVLALDNGTLVRGDVEVHRHASGWFHHGHGTDPAYEGVVLHVVQVPDGAAVDRQGRTIPTIALAGHEHAQTERSQPSPCEPVPETVLRAVEVAGRERFRRKTQRFGRELEGASADEVLWRGIARALGYSRNAAPFDRLAQAVPWQRAAEVVQQGGTVGLAALLLGTAGLLDAATLAEAHAWRQIEWYGTARQQLVPGDWQLAAVRMANHPAARMRGLVELAARWLADDPRDHPAHRVLAHVRAAASQRRPRLWPLVVAAPWIGRGRAQVIAVNVLLPFAAACGVAEAEGLFERLPGEPTNRVVRYMAEQLSLPRRSFSRACQQQGLVQLFGSACAARCCEECPARAGQELCLF